MDAKVCTHTFLTMIIEESACFMSCELYIRNIFLLSSDIFFINWTVRMSDNLLERVQILGHAHIICPREDRIICCQIFCDLRLKSAFERIYNVMQLILVKIKWQIKGIQSLRLIFFYIESCQYSIFYTNCSWNFS